MRRGSATHALPGRQGPDENMQQARHAAGRGLLPACPIPCWPCLPAGGPVVGAERRVQAARRRRHGAGPSAAGAAGVRVPGEQRCPRGLLLQLWVKRQPRVGCSCPCAQPSLLLPLMQPASPLCRELHSAMRRAYLGPRLDQLDSGCLPDAFEADERAAPECPDLLQLVSGRQVLGAVRERRLELLERQRAAAAAAGTPADRRGARGSGAGCCCSFQRRDGPSGAAAAIGRQWSAAGRAGAAGARRARPLHRRGGSGKRGSPLPAALQRQQRRWKRRRQRPPWRRYRYWHAARVSAGGGCGSRQCSWRRGGRANAGPAAATAAGARPPAAAAAPACRGDWRVRARRRAAGAAGGAAAGPRLLHRLLGAPAQRRGAAHAHCVPHADAAGQVGHVGPRWGGGTG